MLAKLPAPRSTITKARQRRLFPNMGGEIRRLPKEYEQEIFAAHEAGHALAALQWKLPFSSITVSSLGGHLAPHQRWLAKLSKLESKKMTALERAALGAVARVALAGDIAAGAHSDYRFGVQAARNGDLASTMSASDRQNAALALKLASRTDAQFEKALAKAIQDVVEYFDEAQVVGQLDVLVQLLKSAGQLAASQVRAVVKAKLPPIDLSGWLNGPQ